MGGFADRWMLCCAALGVAALWPASAGAIGYFNLPGNSAQWWGYGNGGGYHAPLVLGPMSHHGYFGKNVRRFPYAPASPYCGLPLSCGGSGCGCAVGEATLLEPVTGMPETVLPEPAARPTNSPSAHRPPFRY